jgi:hypothetical protein
MHGEGSDQLPRTEGNSRPRHKGVVEAAADLRLGPTVYELCSFIFKDRSVTSVTLQSVLRGPQYTSPVGSGTAGNDAAAAPEDGTVSRGATKLVRPTAVLFGLPTCQGIWPDELQRTDREKYHARRGN